MSDTVIRVENLSKKYLLDHQQEGRSNYKSIKESLPNAMSSLAKKILNPRSNKGFNPSQEEFWALKDVSFEIKQGDKIGIIGRNGAGKSTLLKILSRITEPTSGRIGINGRIASLLEVGTGFHPELTGRENIFLNGAVLGMNKVDIQRKFDQIVDFAGLEKFLDTPVKRYSSGMYVRLAFAVAAHLESEILILDEVLAVGDAQFQKKCLGKIGEVANEGRTIFFVSHNISAVNSLCDRAIYLKNGQVETIGKAEDVVKEYCSEVLQNKVEDLNQFRISGGSNVRFTNIELISEEKVLSFGQPIQYSLTILADQNMNHMRIGSGFFNSSGTSVGSLLSPEFSVKKGESLDLRLTISNGNLAPGLYYGAFSIHFGEIEEEPSRKNFILEMMDHIVGTPVFEIVPISSTNAYVSNWHPNWGSVVFTDVDLQVEKCNQIPLTQLI
jgi:lipopolysaccharide transport system ATP-binding protein